MFLDLQAPSPHISPAWNMSYRRAWIFTNGEMRVSGGLIFDFIDIRAELRPHPAVFPVPGQHLEGLRGCEPVGHQPEQVLIRAGTA